MASNRRFRAVFTSITLMMFCAQVLASGLLECCYPAVLSEFHDPLEAVQHVPTNHMDHSSLAADVDLHHQHEIHQQHSSTDLQKHDGHTNNHDCNFCALAHNGNLPSDIQKTTLMPPATISKSVYSPVIPPRSADSPWRPPA